MTPHHSPSPGLRWNLLDDSLIRWRCTAHGDLQRSSLPELLAAMTAADRVRDFPALRPHQRHPWHAFLAQLGAIALHRAGQTQPWTEAPPWRAALLGLTPDDADGAAWCLVAPPGRPALLQAAVPGERVTDWKNVLHAADELDMLVTSKNHDLKSARARARRSEPDDWLFALLSLQTQGGFLGRKNYGISRMDGGLANRPGVGVVPAGEGWGARWTADLQTLLMKRTVIAEQQELMAEGGHALLWLLPWSGTESLSMQTLDPLYIEVCQRVRLDDAGGVLLARKTVSEVSRVAGKERNGRTGDPWTPVNRAKGKALTVQTRDDFTYELMTKLLTGGDYEHGAAWRLDGWPRDATLQVLVQVIARGTRGKGRTEGYHERRIPISPKLRRSLLGLGPQRVDVATIAKQRIAVISEMRKLLRHALVTLFAIRNYNDSPSNNDKAKVDHFTQPFEANEDSRFFDDLAQEAEADDADRLKLRLCWLRGLEKRAERVLTQSFNAGPRSGMQRYKARAVALWHVRGLRSKLPDLADHYARSCPDDTDRTQYHA
ncbi:type I-E CRISPR-associated protein Cse1/CasA [Verminephrobacter aporrectodeae subsp. tuberculatae]|uniref:type I-E CRISPR-associated protein Cse1/CasA n=1 Tax=Verminephrobacter aporrectodeae TaxID=1110389 RepID=UPI0022435B0E|nr:type I-E CRISPR-associated protein Cse1/CasA [Verminephrobacter aporrectodeae]MCW8168352.1 type I-E CRISPR-associated protein Cse1/CasA [Verminephrobacter aporrectodeae subsp. tuberculatae]